jgi:hypothetical protein
MICSNGIIYPLSIVFAAVVQPAAAVAPNRRPVLHGSDREPPAGITAASKRG